MNPPRWVAVARLGRTRGLKGEIFADGDYQRTGKVTLFRGEDVVGEFTVVSVTPYKGRLIFRFKEAPTIDEAEPLNGCTVCIPEDERTPLEEGEYYLSDLVGCTAVEAGTTRVIGTVENWQECGGPAVIEIRRAGGGEPLLVPFAKAIWVGIDLGARRGELNLPEGLEAL